MPVHGWPTVIYDAQVDCEVGTPRVNYREAIQARSEFDYLHRKQSGGQVGSLAFSSLYCILGCSHPEPQMLNLQPGWNALDHWQPGPALERGSALLGIILPCTNIFVLCCALSGMGE